MPTGNPPHPKGAKHPNWKGKDASYSAIHAWVRTTIGVPSQCAKCKRKMKGVQWANISGKYKRVVSDWLALCPLCHTQFDGKHAFTIDQVRLVVQLYEKGKKQVEIARIFEVDQSTISRVLNGKRKTYAQS